MLGCCQADLGFFCHFHVSSQKVTKSNDEINSANSLRKRGPSIPALKPLEWGKKALVWPGESQLSRTPSREKAQALCSLQAGQISKYIITEINPANLAGLPEREGFTLFSLPVNGFSASLSTSKAPKFPNAAGPQNHRIFGAARDQLFPSNFICTDNSCPAFQERSHLHRLQRKIQNMPGKPWC